MRSESCWDYRFPGSKQRSRHSITPWMLLSCLYMFVVRMLERSSCGASFENVKISDLDFEDDAVIFAETLDIILGALDVLNEESERQWDYACPWSKLRSRLSMTSWMLLSCLYLIVATILRSQIDLLTFALMFMSLLAVSQRSIDVWVGPGKS